MGANPASSHLCTRNVPTIHVQRKTRRTSGVQQQEATIVTRNGPTVKVIEWLIQQRICFFIG